MKKRILVFGDIHGCYEKLLETWERARPEKGDTVIFLGDYIDRGRQNWKVLDFLMGLRDDSERKVVLLPGNHEMMALVHIRQYGMLPVPSLWMENGGTKTILELIRLSGKKREKVVNFFEEILCHPYHREKVVDNEIIFVHGGMNPDKSMSEQTLDDFLWSREHFYNGYRGKTQFVVGHTPVQCYRGMKALPLPIWWNEKILLLDTGSYLEGGKVTCYDVTNQCFYASK